VKSVSGKKFAKTLEKKGWELIRTKGSHYIFAKVGNSARISVPIHGNSPLKIGLLRYLMKIAEIDENEL